MSKLPFLETSPVRFPPPLGGGSYSTGCPTATGSPTSAGAPATPASSSSTETLSKPPSEDLLTLPPEVQKWWHDTKMHVWRGTENEQFVNLPQASKRFWMGVFIRETGPRTMVYRGYPIQVPPNLSGRDLDEYLEAQVHKMHDEEVSRLRAMREEQAELRTPKMRGLCDCGLVAKDDCSCLESGSNGEKNRELLEFWNTRVHVHRKG